jgi:hypothetical protein
VLVIGSSGAATTPLFTIDSTSTLDLADNDMAILYGTGTTPMPAVTNALDSAYDTGLWDKPGLTSSIARKHSSAYGLGYAEASAIGATAFDGVALGGNAVLVKYTLLGDTDLRGSVGIGDYDTVLSNYGTPQGWTGGDFHYGGVVGLGDYDDILSNYGVEAEPNLATGPSLTTTTTSRTIGTPKTKPRPLAKVKRKNAADVAARKTQPNLA